MGDRVAVVSGDDRLTYSELFEAAGRAAARLRASDAKHLAILDTSSPALPIAVFAAAWAGKPFVPLNYRLTGSELENLVGQITPGQIVTDRERVDSLASLSGFGSDRPRRLSRGGSDCGDRVPRSRVVDGSR